VSLTAADVAEILRLLEQSSFDELNLEMNGVKLSLRRGASAAAGGAARDAGTAFGAGGAGIQGATAGAEASAARVGATAFTGGPGGTGGPAPGTGAGGAAASSAANSGASAGAAPHSAATHAVPSRTTDPDVHDVPSPLLGTFYRSPKPGAPPFVEVGSTVTEDTIVAIIEVMKLMNTVRAGARGTVAEILPTDGTLVEYDQPILRIRKSG
jgi:acetyl-CoA carboxylase biotin carboxyl carrier protein